jgi:peptidoglycan/LPS O-acetylase OafA/YrhL
MIHVPFFMVGFNLLQDVLGVVDQTVSWPVLLMMLVVMIGVSAGTYEWIERPARTRLRAWGEALISRPRRP